MRYRKRTRADVPVLPASGGAQPEPQEAHQPLEPGDRDPEDEGRLPEKVQKGTIGHRG